MKKKRTKQTKGAKRQSRQLFKLSTYGSCIEDAYRLEAILAKKPKRLQIDIAGSGQIWADSALLLRSVLLNRSPRTRIVTNARSSLEGATVLIWLLGDLRLIREDARLYFRGAGPFQNEADKRPVWNDRSFFYDDPLEEEDYLRVLQAINEFLPVKELAGRPVEVSVLKEFGLVDNENVDGLLARAFGRGKERNEKPRTSKQKQAVKEASR
jgi:hypothetical protein